MTRKGKGRSRRIHSVGAALRIAAVAGAIVAASTSALPSQESFHEELLLRPLPDGRVHAQFEFVIASTDGQETSRSEDGSDSSTIASSHYSLLPRALLQIAQAQKVEELHLTMNAGKWDYTTWGYPTYQRIPHDAHPGVQMIGHGEEGVGTGAELWARLRGEKTVQSEKEAQRLKPKLQRWRGLTASLAGLFCASLDSLDDTRTTMPSVAYGAGSSNSSHLLHAFLASEGVCTENLTPFLKMLPCKHAAGLASLLSPHALFGAAFHGLGVHVTRVEDSESGDELRQGWNVRLTFQAVFSPAVSREHQNRDWSLSSLFGRSLSRSCPIVETSTIRVTRPQAQSSDRETRPIGAMGASRYVLDPVPAVDDEEEEIRQRLGHDGDVLYDVRSLQPYGGQLDVSMRWPGEAAFSYPASIAPPPLVASRVLTGFGQERGHIELIVRNHESRERRVLYYEELPWFVKPYLHTLDVRVDSDSYNEQDNIAHFHDELDGSLLTSVSYQPALTRARPLLLEAGLRIPPLTSVRLSFSFDKAFLRYTEHPPDAHRGFDLPPAVIIPLDEDADESNTLGEQMQRRVLGHARIGRAGANMTRRGGAAAAPVGRTPRIYTQPGLLELAVPDFSMPYNVIILSSTVMALFFGSVFNNLVRRYADVTVYES